MHRCAERGQVGVVARGHGIGDARGRVRVPGDPAEAREVLRRGVDVRRGEPAQHGDARARHRAGMPPVLAVEVADRRVGGRAGRHRVEHRREVDVHAGTAQLVAPAAARRTAGPRRAASPARRRSAPVLKPLPCRRCTSPPSWSVATNSPMPRGASACNRSVSERVAARPCVAGAVEDHRADVVRGRSRCGSRLPIDVDGRVHHQQLPDPLALAHRGEHAPGRRGGRVP